ncbi:SRPBCC family protein [Xanthobacter tagetidis]|uniref:Membrane oxidoreductase n=1 Tax=Xanthobacter tagetidis TaxID=60216 RepID=A0A3L7AC93_9HYPH|nr:SRPBCC family protein [Xanthobacter tagetidis]MBB6306055.1 carbon monoxide dehydrogenase subunit G [Xanthobacter tagetidis]RLP77615.1 membrane oxidoreductase [Xanthobacter tagetidis]
MKIENTFRVDLPPDEAWRVLLDIPALVPCMPGAELIAVEGERTYRGQMKLKLGPVAVAFQGRAEVVEIDEDGRSVRARASGTETKGRGNASADVAFRLAPEGAGSRVDVTTDVNLAGAVAQYGRAQGVIAGVAQVLVDQFAANLAARLAAERRAAAAPNEGRSAAVPSAPQAQGLSVLALLVAYIRGRLARLVQRNAS